MLGTARVDPIPAIYRAEGCSFCEQQGYKGRTALMEVLSFDPEMDELVARGATTHELARHALEQGFTPLADVGIARVLDGTTSLDEVSRVVDLTQRVK